MMHKLDINIIGSGSSGNAVRIENILMDIGLPYKRIKDDLQYVNTILITHRHTDHVNLATLKRIMRLHPEISIYCNKDVFDYVWENTDLALNILDANKVYQLGDSTYINPFHVKHDVPCYGYTFKINDLDVIYVTDSAGTDWWRDGLYDYLLIESNHDENLLLERCKKMKYNAFSSAKRHTSTQEAMYWYYTHRKSKDSVLYELHKSSRFYKDAIL